MEKLLQSIGNLKNSKIKKLVECRIKEFKRLGKESNNEIFKELCFCILTANYSAEKGIIIQKAIDDGFLNLTKSELAKKLKSLGYRYPNKRAQYIVGARKHKNMLKKIIKSLNGNELRKWVVANIKGLGYKEASHFLRNIGYDGFAIIDFHIIDLLEKHRLLKGPKTLTKKKYLEIEALLNKISEKSKLNLSELDLYLWYMETGRILK